MDPLDIFPATVWQIVAALFGAVWGSFANVFVCRWPEGRSVVAPRSHCGSCGTPVSPWDNVPVLSFLLLRGRCRACGGAISWRYPLVEASLAALSVAVFRSTVLEASSLEAVTVLEYLATFLLCWSLVVVAFVDLDTQLVPTTLTGVVAAVGLAAHLVLPGGHPTASAIGVVVGFGAVWLLGNGYRLFRGELGMGMGDAYLMAMVGAFLGWKGALATLVLGSVQGALVHLVLYAADRRLRRSAIAPWRRPVPFGPFLVVGALEVLLFGDWLALAFARLT